MSSLLYFWTNWAINEQIEKFWYGVGLNDKVWGSVGGGVGVVRKCGEVLGEVMGRCQVRMCERGWEVSVERRVRWVWGCGRGVGCGERCRRVCGLPHTSSHLSTSQHIFRTSPQPPHLLHTLFHTSPILSHIPDTSTTPQHTFPILPHIFPLLSSSPHTWPNSLNY